MTTNRSKSFVIETLQPLRVDVHLLFTLSFDRGQKGSTGSSPFAWDVINFSANDIKKETVTWHPGRNLSRYVNDSVDQNHISGPIKAENYIEWSGNGEKELKWAANTLFYGSDDPIIAINRSNGNEKFVLGVIPENHSDFQPYVLLKELEPTQGIATEFPYLLQVYVVKNMRKHRVVTEELERGLLVDKDNKLGPLRLESLGDTTRWTLHNDGGRVKSRFVPSPIELVLDPSKPNGELPPVTGITDEIADNAPKPPPSSVPTGSTDEVSKRAVVDLRPLLKRLKDAAAIIEKQIPHENDIWGQTVLDIFGDKVSPLLNDFVEESPTWNGFQ